MNSYEVIQIAKKYAELSGNQSAKLLLEDAISLQSKGACVYARNRAMQSLKHSVGIFHEDYILCCNGFIPKRQTFS